MFPKNLHITDWAAWAPGLTNQSDWKSYLNREIELSLDSKPDVGFLPPMFRRKLSPLSRIVFTTVNSLRDTSVLEDCPLIFASRHGELDLSLKLIDSIVNVETVSPAGFSMSVHNSIAGLLSIHYKNTEAMTAIAAGQDTLKMGILEASAQLTKSEKVILCYADNNMPQVYKDFDDEKLYPRCLVLVLEQGIPQKEFQFTGNNNCFEDIVRKLIQD